MERPLKTFRRRTLKSGEAVTRSLKDRAERWDALTVVAVAVVSIGFFFAIQEASRKAAELVVAGDTGGASHRPSVGAADVIVEVTPERMVVGTTVLGKEALDPNEPGIPALVEVLQAHKAQAPMGTFCLIRSEKRGLFMVIKRVMASCKAAGYPDVDIETM